MDKEEKQKLYTFIILITIGIIIGCVFYIYFEIDSAKDACNERGLDYDLKWPMKHYCNDKEFVKYTEGWVIAGEHEYLYTNPLRRG